MRWVSCIASCAIVCAVCQPALAGALYKCLEGGRVIYADRPCNGAGAPLALAPAPAPDPLQAARLADARATLQALDKRLSEQAQREDQAFERAGRAALALRTRCAKLRLQRRWADEDLARSSDDATALSRVKARRLAEGLAVECPD